MRKRGSAFLRILKSNIDFYRLKKVEENLTIRYNDIGVIGLMRVILRYI
jgi:hypothetical protein